MASLSPQSLPLHFISSSTYRNYHNQNLLLLQLQEWKIRSFTSNKLNRLSFTPTFMQLKRRKTLICAVSQDAESSFKKTVEVDRLIDTLREASPGELQKLVVQNVLAFDAGFWIRLAARSDTCKSEDDKKDYEELAGSVMSIVHSLVHKTKQKIESATDVLKSVLRPAIDEKEEVTWPPRDPEVLKLMEKAVEDGDKPGLVAMLQKVLQLYASEVLSKRSYAKRGDEILKAEQFLETIIKAPEEEWNKLLIDGITLGKGEISPEELYAVINKRIERMLIRTEGGSYEQRVLSEYLNGIQSRAEQIVQVLEGKL
ncbi:uncharacterized protein LOC126683185 isoform X2 [Mercurialis annua]|uniref:uncharacterized protein LOC126683185 isoform X2 n=1 Tax=Mercurialis annua TaxID=3986 RepID=UPI0024ACA864|nr:uncharacterized protein LOC126683185 isoform X2 [Mercurialis annua]